MMNKICCEAMKYHSTNHCNIHNSPYECPDWMIVHNDNGDYGIVIHDGGESYVKINYCPWCGQRLPDLDDE